LSIHRPTDSHCQITDSVDEFVSILAEQKLLSVRAAVMRSAMILVDTDFSVGDETRSDNRYMPPVAIANPKRARQQLSTLIDTLHGLSVPVVSFASHPQAPDSIFSNNAFATIEGRLITGAMRHPLRQKETDREDILAWFQGVAGYEVMALEGEGRVVELTGVMAIDRVRNIGFCGMTGRVNSSGLDAMAAALDLDLVLAMNLVESEYHCNVVLAILAGRVAVVHPGSIADSSCVRALETCYGKSVLCISDEEKNAFLANCLAATQDDVLLSQTAMDALSYQSRTFFDREGLSLHPVDVSEFEKAGGSLRCMITEVY